MIVIKINNHFLKLHLKLCLANASHNFKWVKISCQFETKHF